MFPQQDADRRRMTERPRRYADAADRPQRNPASGKEGADLGCTRAAELSPLALRLPRAGLRDGDAQRLKDATTPCPSRRSADRATRTESWPER